MKWNNRSQYSYSLLDFMYNILWPLKWIKFKCFKILDTLNNRYQLYSAGERKLVKELSVVSFVKIQRKLKTVVRLLMTRQQQKLSTYSRLSKLKVESDNSSSSSSEDMLIPKMLDNSNTKQQHSEAVEKFFDEYLQQKHTVTDYKLMHEVYSNKECPDFNNIDEICDNNLNSQPNANSKELDDPPNKTIISTVDLIHKSEEQKVISPKSSISALRLMRESDNEVVQYFDESDF